MNLPVDLATVATAAFDVQKAQKTVVSVNLLIDESATPEFQTFVRSGFNSDSPNSRLTMSYFPTQPIDVGVSSDLTVLVNMMLAKNVGHPYTGPVLSTLGYSNEAAVKRMRDMMAGRPGDVKLRVVKAGEKPAEGLAMGGLLDRLHRLSEKSLLPDAAGRVVFIENTNKYAPRTDEMLGGLREKGVFDKAVAVVFCDFNSKAPPEETKAKMSKFAAQVPCPVFAGYPYGHISDTSIIDFRRKLEISPDGVLFWSPDSPSQSD